MSRLSAKKLKEAVAPVVSPAVEFTRKVLVWWIPILYLLIVNAFYLRTYDSAQVKITLVQMGGLAIMTMWGSLMMMSGRKSFKRTDFAFLAPFLIYLAYVVLSFINVPYKGPSIDDFVRYLFYMSVSMIVISEFNSAAIDRLTKILIIAAYITIGYGMVQIIDAHFFPRSAPGLDPFVWRGAFGTRVFSTFGNPNFFGNFILLIFFVLVAQFLKNKSFYLIPLIIMDLLCLYFTETKGAWVGFGVTSFIFIIVYAFFFLREYYEKYRTRVHAIAITFLACTLLVVGYFAYKRMNSVSFRVFTWLSTWEMIESRPLSGTGVGTFKVIYPAFRRPQIFHIEAKHNTETDHAEDEYLEQWYDNGIIGFGIFIWLILFTVVVGFRALYTQTSLTAKTNGRPPPIAYDLLGYITALLGMLCHNFFDVSLRFVSSGIFLGLLPGIIINLSRGKGLYELHEDNAQKDEPASEGAGLWAARAAVICGLLVLTFIFIKDFAELQGPLAYYMQPGEVLQWWIAWAVFLAVVLSLAGVFARIAYLCRSFMAIGLIALMLYPMFYLWGFFKADVYHNLAIYYSKQQAWPKAIENYKNANRENPFFIMPYYFMGNVYKDRFDLNKTYMPEWGDTNQVARTDYDRAMDEYEKVRKIAPNYVQMHFQVGELYMKMANYYFNTVKDQQKGNEFLDKALARLNVYHNLDPVFPYTYYHLGQIYTSKHEYDKALKQYQDNINAPYCYHKPGDPGLQEHQSAEAYTNLAQMQYIMGKPKDAEESLREALEQDPNYAPAKDRMQMIGRPVMQSVGPAQINPARPAK